MAAKCLVTILGRLNEARQPVKPILSTALLIMAGLLAGCSTLPPLQSARPNPVSSLKFSGTVEQAFEIARSALLANGISPRAGSSALGYVSGEHGASAWSWGEIVAVYFKEDSPGNVLLWVVSKPKLATNVTATDWTGRLLAAIKMQISRIEQARSESGQRTPSPAEPTESTGTGFLIGTNGTVVTAYHVIEDATEIQVRLPSGAWVDARPLKHSRTTDLAILGVPMATPAYLTIADMSGVKQGQRVFTLGHPVSSVLGEEVKYTDGVISSLTGLQGEDCLMQITVPIQPGNSGGPLVNEAGEVVGVITSSAAVSAFLRLTGTLPQNVNWAVKANYLTSMVGDQPETQTVSDADVIERVKKAVVFIRCK